MRSRRLGATREADALRSARQQQYRSNSFDQKVKGEAEKDMVIKIGCRVSSVVVVVVVVRAGALVYGLL